MATRGLLAVLLACLAAASTGASSSPSTCPTRHYTRISGKYVSSPSALGEVDAAVAASAPPGKPVYTLTVPRSNVTSVCSLGRAGEEYKTYLPMLFEDGAVRMIKPVAKNSGCASAKETGARSSGLEMTFKLLDSAQVGIARCTSRATECDVYIYESTGAAGYNKEGQAPRGRAPRGRALASHKRCDDEDECFSCTDYCTKDKCKICNWHRCDCTANHHGCFPADAVVTTARGATRISALKIGDKALAARPDGSTFLDDVYMFGHKDAAAASSFVRLETAGGAALRLTADHHLFVTRGGERLGVPSSQALVGDLVLVEGRLGASLQLEAIVAKSLVPGAGLFNPYTLSGAIVVDGVAASCHSSSALDGAFRRMGVSVPDGYQAAFAPLRAMYRALGADRMAAIEFIIDAAANAANTGTLLFALGPVASAVARGAWLAWR